MYTNMGGIMTDDMAWQKYNQWSHTQNKIVKTKISMNIPDHWDRYHSR